MTKLCSNCNKPIPIRKLRWKQAKYCSSKCNKEYCRKEFKRLNPRPNVNTCVIGAISELKVAIDLLSKGFNVFKSISEGAVCDFIILKGSKVLTVEVKTGHISPFGKILNPPVKLKVDLVAIVLQDKIIYSPEVF